jgi:hypothetical protein
MTPPFIPNLISVLGLGASLAGPRTDPEPMVPVSPWGAAPRHSGPVARVPVLPMLSAAYPPRRLATR